MDPLLEKQMFFKHILGTHIHDTLTTPLNFLNKSQNYNRYLCLVINGVVNLVPKVLFFMNLVHYFFFV